MAAFTYIALDIKGKEQKGILEADSSRQIRQQLRDKGYTPLIIRTASNAIGSQGNNNGGSSFKLSVADLAMITRQIATLVQASMPLEEALSAVSSQSESAKVRSIILSVRAKVLEGHSLAESLADFPLAFPVLFRATVAAGEHAGHLDLVLDRLADYAEHSYAARQKIKLAMLYPVILFVMAITIVSGLMAFVVPDVVEVFVGQGQKLPTLTTGLIAVSDFVVSYGWLLVGLCVALILIVRIAMKSDGFKLQVDKYLLTVPLLGRVIRGSNSARFASTLTILTGSGVPLVDAMGIAAEVLANSWIKASVIQATQQVREGGSLHKALENSGHFPPMMVHMVASGEMSGELDAMLARVADHQQKQLDNLTATLIGVFEPAMLLFMGAAVLIIVVAILQPIFDINALI